MARVGRGAEQYTVRFSEGLRDRIKAYSVATGRSMNDLIVEALEEKYPAPTGSYDPYRVQLLVSDMREIFNAIQKEDFESAEYNRLTARFEELSQEVTAALGEIEEF